MIRHASRGATSPVRPLPIAMVETTLGAQLVATVGPPHLAPALLTSAGHAAVAVSPETRTTHKEQRAAAIGPATLLQKQDLRAASHPVPQAGLDTGARLMPSSRSSFGGCFFGATQKPRSLRTVGVSFLRLRSAQPNPQFDAPSARMMLALTPGGISENYVSR